MTTRRVAILGAAALAMTPVLAAAQSQAQQPIALPPPRADFGKSLAQALKLRRSIREYDPRPLSPQVLSELLWSAYGVNRPSTADRTAPSWRHARETDVFAVMAEGYGAMTRSSTFWCRIWRATCGRRPVCRTSSAPRR